jgi:hypothetical protein
MFEASPEQAQRVEGFEAGMRNPGTGTWNFNSMFAQIPDSGFFRQA